MKRLVQIAICFGVLASACHAEPRWCSITEKNSTNKFAYPTIARLARVRGTVTMRMVYEPTGKVVRVEAISGPPLLSSGLGAQLMEWTVKTGSVGDAMCQTLVVAEFKLYDQPGPKLEGPKFSLEPSGLRLSVDAEPVPVDTVICDPVPLRGWKLVLFQIRSNVRRAFGMSFRFL